MQNLINFLLYYLNPVNFINLLWDLVLDAVYLILQLVIDTFAMLLAGINWICPVFPNLAPPTSFDAGGTQVQFAKIIKYIAWVIPWNYALNMITVMIGCTMFALMTTWILRWVKVVK